MDLIINLDSQTGTFFDICGVLLLMLLLCIGIPFYRCNIHFYYQPHSIKINESISIQHNVEYVGDTWIGDNPAFTGRREVVA
jgi:hypothetical protein